MHDPQRKKTISYIAGYCALVTALAWIGPLLGGSPSSPGAGFVLWGAAPLLAAIMIRLATRDWSDAGLKPAIGANFRWYIVSAAALPVAMASTLLLGEAFKASSVSGFALEPYTKSFLPAFAVFFVFAIFEEFGWRGYLAPKLASIGGSSYLAYAVTAVAWASWHLPYIRELTWVYTPEDLATFIPRFYLAMFAYSILYNEIRVITGSVWPAVLMHCLANSVGHPLFAEFVVTTPGKEYLVSPTGFFMVVIVGLLGVALNQWRVRRMRLMQRQANG